MDEEYNALLRNLTWELVPPTSRPPIGCKWLFRVKRHPDGSIAKYKARLVAKGFLQEYGKDYFDTFSPVTKPVTIRTVLALALSRGWSSRQLDVNNAFLQGHLQEEVYMIQPPGYVNQQFPKHVCKLRRSLYGLKQAPRAWYMALTAFLVEFGFLKSHADASLFIYNRDGVTCYFLVYVDDIILTSNNDEFINTFVQRLSSRFSLKDLGSPSHFLGVELIPTTHGLFLSQHRHIHDLLTIHKMDGAKVVQTPLCSSQVLTLEDGTPKVDPTPYRKLVGSLQYLAFTRPDISFAVNKLSQFMHQPTQTHWQALKRLLRYLKGTIYHGLFLRKHSPLELTAFSDSDWGGVSSAGRSTTAYVIYLGGNIISWKSARQKSVSRSSTEAEYKALANAAAELAWVENLLKELGISIPRSPLLYCDNTGATYLCANPVYHSRMKHVALDYHFVREKVAAGTLRVHHINTKDQLADALTKPLSRAPFLHLRSKIGVSDGTSILRGPPVILHILCIYCVVKILWEKWSRECGAKDVEKWTRLPKKDSLQQRNEHRNLLLQVILLLDQECPYLLSQWFLVGSREWVASKSNWFDTCRALVSRIATCRVLMSRTMDEKNITLIDNLDIQKDDFTIKECCLVEMATMTGYGLGSPANRLHKDRSRFGYDQLGHLGKTCEDNRDSLPPRPDQRSGTMLNFLRIRIAFCCHQSANICGTLNLQAHNFATKSCNNNSVSLYLERSRLIDRIRIVLRSQDSQDSLVSILNDPALDSFVVANALKSAPSPDAALNVIETLKNIPHFVHNQSTLYALAKVLAKSRQTGKLKALVNGINSGKFRNVGRLGFMDRMKLYAAAGDLDSVLCVWHEWRVSQKFLNVESYNVIMRMCVHMGKDYEAVTTFGRMIDEGGVPNSRTYTVIIEHLVSSGNLDSAIEVFNLLPSMNVKHTIMQFSVLWGRFLRC
ncbi:hypothetical protein OSB04_007458 [Centaurea solstitialis]|uniref:Reverse transcriptase Ty1/copia-type domain-containing protein n=1 Tax=Centaurea solstitialis TaxID=347529 RepID=A0AA38U4G6_9ASTR|nr:hypothetical protein OSB04_007458 [Centaurea solstitialis]